jgi:hypothetical protein
MCGLSPLSDAGTTDGLAASGILGLQLTLLVSLEIEAGYTHIKSKRGTGAARPR